MWREGHGWVTYGGKQTPGLTSDPRRGGTQLDSPPGHALMAAVSGNTLDRTATGSQGRGLGTRLSTKPTSSLITLVSRPSA